MALLPERRGTGLRHIFDYSTAGTSPSVAIGEASQPDYTRHYVLDDTPDCDCQLGILGTDSGLVGCIHVGRP